MYRVSLGRSPIGSNLVTTAPSTGTFATGLTAGKFYRVGFTKDQPDLMFSSVGNIRVNGYEGLTGEIEFDRLCIENGSLVLDRVNTAAPMAFTGVSCYELDWNAPLVNEPKGWEDFDITTVRDENINGLVVQYTSELTFIGDGYTYLKNILDSDGYCAEVPVLIEERCSELDEWETFFEGSINLINSEIDSDNCQLSTKISDMGALKKLSTGKNIEVATFYEGYPLGAEFEDRSFLKFYNRSGAYVPGSNHGYTAARSVYARLKHIVTQISDGQIAFESDLYSSGTFEKLYLVNATAFNSTASNVYDSKLSFDKILKELNKHFNITFGITYAGSIPTVRVEYSTYFESDTPILTLVNVPDIKITISTENLYRTVTVGTKKLRDEDESKGVQYASKLGCAGNDLNLLSDWIVDSDIMHDLMDQVLDINSYLQDLFLVEAEPDPGDPSASFSKLYPGNSFNGLLSPHYAMTRHITTLNSPMYVSTDKTDIIEKDNVTNPAKFREYEFKYPLTKAQFSLISTPGQTIEFSGGNITTPVRAYILEADYNKKTGLTKFKLLGE